MLCLWESVYFIPTKFWPQNISHVNAAIVCWVTTSMQSCCFPSFWNSWRPSLQLLGRPVPTCIFLVAPEEPQQSASRPSFPHLKIARCPWRYPRLNYKHLGSFYRHLQIFHVSRRTLLTVESSHAFRRGEVFNYGSYSNHRSVWPHFNSPSKSSYPETTWTLRRSILVGCGDAMSTWPQDQVIPWLDFCYVLSLPCPPREPRTLK